MKKSLVGAAALLLAAGLFIGCGSEELTPLNEMDVEQYVTLGDYSDLGVTVGIESQIQQLMSQVYHDYMSAEDGIMNRAVEIGDGVDIDYEGKLDGVAFEGGTAQGAFLAIGSGQFINGFEDGLVGVMPGETVDLDLTFPTYYGNADLAGQAVVFTVTVNYIVPDEENMKDSVVELMGVEEIATVEALRQDVYNYLYDNSSEIETVKNDTLAELVSRCTYEKLPQDMVKSEREYFASLLEQIAGHYGIAAEDFAPTYYGLTAEEFAQTFAERSVREYLTLQAIANRENLRVSDEELQEQLELYAAASGYATVEEFMGENTLEDYRNYFMEEKVIRFLIDGLPTE